jgi:hypothetical protein
MDDNPYRAPTAVVADPVAPLSEAERVRQAHIRHEVSLKSVGALYFLGAMFMLLAALLLIPAFDGGSDSSVLAGLMALYLALGLGMGVLAYGFRTLRPWVRIPGGILSGLGLLAVPIGTLIHAYILYLMFCAQGRRILSSDYRDIVRATPHVKYRRSLGDWIATGIVILLLLGVVLLIVLG